jgi:hypothetical protein
MFKLLPIAACGAVKRPLPHHPETAHQRDHIERITHLFYLRLDDVFDIVAAAS